MDDIILNLAGAVIVFFIARIAMSWNGVMLQVDNLQHHSGLLLFLGFYCLLTAPTSFIIKSHVIVPINGKMESIIHLAAIYQPYNHQIYKPKYSCPTE